MESILLRRLEVRVVWVVYYAAIMGEVVDFSSFLSSGYSFSFFLTTERGVRVWFGGSSARYYTPMARWRGRNGVACFFNIDKAGFAQLCWGGLGTFFFFDESKVMLVCVLCWRVVGMEGCSTVSQQELLRTHDCPV